MIMANSIFILFTNGLSPKQKQKANRPSTDDDTFPLSNENGVIPNKNYTKPTKENERNWKRKQDTEGNVETQFQAAVCD